MKSESKNGAPPSEGTPSGSFNDQFHMMQILIEVSKDVSVLSSQTNRLINDNEKLSSDFGELAKKISRYENLIVGGMAVLIVAGGFFGWIFSDQLTQLKNQITQSSAQQAGK